MVLPVKRWFAIAFLVSAIATTQTAAFAAERTAVIIKVSGHDYLTVDNVSRFYGLPAGVTGSGEKIDSRLSRILWNLSAAAARR